MTRAWLLFVSVSAVAAALLSSVRGLWSDQGLSVAIAAFSLLLGAFVSGFPSWGNLRRWVMTLWKRADDPGRVLFLFIFLASAMSFVALYAEVEGKWGTANPNNLGDLPYHLHLIESFARGTAFPPADPTFAGERLHYAYGVNLWDALWVKCGVPVAAMLTLTGVVSLFVAMTALWRAGGLFLLCCFFFSGGVGVSTLWAKTFGPQSEHVWKNLFHAVLVTQRGYLWALPAGLYLMRKWTRFLGEKDFRPGTSFFWIWAVTPFFHLHTFVILSFWMGLTLVLERRWDRRFWAWGALAAVFVLRSLNPGKVDSALGWSWGWMIESPGALVTNFGPWLVIPLFLSIRWARERNWKSLAIAWIVTFFAVNLKTAPWIWDQVKMILWAYLLWTFWAIHEYKWKGRTAFLFAFFLCWPGALQWFSGWPSMTGRFDMQDAADKAQVLKLLEDLSPDQVVAADVDFRHPLLGSGQRLLLAYPGQAWAHGLPVNGRQEAQKQILQGLSGGDRIARELGVSRIVWKDDPRLTATPPLESWSRWGWSEEKRVGVWHLWKTGE